MPSTFAWLDFSDRDRKRALDVVDLFREEEARDELGIGTIRDAIADRLFPGTSTIQTRIRYFLFIPWLFQSLSARDSAPDRFTHQIRQLQDRLREGLVSGGEARGVIGFRAGRSVQRLPSSVYWQGLRRLRILRYSGSEYDYRSALLGQRHTLDISKNDDGELLHNAKQELWDPRLPEPPARWLESTTFALRPEEATYLEHCVNMTAPKSLFAHLIDLRRQPKRAAFPWDHVPQEGLPIDLQSEVNHARNFSESIHGSSLLYNLMLAEEKPGAAREQMYQSALAEWWERIVSRRAAIASWDRSRFWTAVAGWGARVRPSTHTFVEAWLEAVNGARRVENVIGNRGLRDLIRVREGVLKGPRARLGNPRALDLWSGASGTAQLDYRWNRPVAGMLNDLIRGLVKS